MWIMLMTVGHFLTASQGGEQIVPYAQNGVVQTYTTKALCEKEAKAVAVAIRKVEGVDLPNRTRCVPQQSVSNKQ
jgi:hypothetical protein